MAWQLQHVKHETFSRNPLVVVTSQLRFHPIVLIRQGERIGAFQDKIRQKFPIFAEEKMNVLTATNNPSGGEVVWDTKQETQYTFATENGNVRIILSSALIAIENKMHERRAQLVEDFELAINALTSVYGGISAVRLGLRYVDLINRDKLARDLGRNVQWCDIVSPQFLALPTPVDLDSTLFYKEITSSVRSEGALTLRYGLLRDTDHVIKFRFDSDRYLNASYDVAKTREKIMSFSDDIYALFMMATGPVLKEWMLNGEEAA